MAAAELRLREVAEATIIAERQREACVVALAYGELRLAEIGEPERSLPYVARQR